VRLPTWWGSQHSHPLASAAGDHHPFEIGLARWCVFSSVPVLASLTGFHTCGAASTKLPPELAATKSKILQHLMASRVFSEKRNQRSDFD
jgi:hypothetical protein